MDPATVVKKQGIALTGGIASGKSWVAKLLVARGFTVFDADQFARQVVEPGQRGLLVLEETFGSSVIQSGRLDRLALRKMIAHDPKARLQINAILHPLIRETYFQAVLALEQPTFHFHFYEAALIFENAIENDFYQVWLCDCSYEVQLHRLMARDESTKHLAEAIIASQWPREKKIAKHPVIIDTDVSEDLLEKQLFGLLETLKGKAK